MDTNGSAHDREAVARRRSRRRWAGAAGLLGAGLLTGAVLAGTLSAGAATSNGSSGSGSGISSSSSASTWSSSAQRPGNPASAAHGPGETVLTGSTAAKVTAAAKAAVRGATVIRVETDSDGATYEAHMQKADGSFVTVKIDKNFKVTSTISGFGGGPGHAGAPDTGA